MSFYNRPINGNVVIKFIIWFGGNLLVGDAVHYHPPYYRERDYTSLISVGTLVIQNMLLKCVLKLYQELVEKRTLFLIKL